LEFHTGYPSDHRALIVDFDPSSLFGQATSTISRQQSRKLTSTNPRTMVQYIQHVRQAFQSNNICKRVQALHDTMAADNHATTAQIETYLKLDAQITEMLLTAESKCRKDTGGDYFWSPEYQSAQQIAKYWSMRLSQHRTQIDHSRQLAALSQQLAEAYPEVTQPNLTQRQLEEQVRKENTRLNQVKKDAQALRETFLQERAEFYSIVHRTNSEVAIRNILKAESMARKYRAIRRALKGEQSPGLDRVQVPANSPEGSAHNDTLHWAITKEEVHSALQAVNPARFRGHAPTPFGQGERMKDIGSDCTSHSVQDILNGVYNFKTNELTAEQQEWIRQLKRTDQEARQEARVEVKISHDDFVSAWSKYRESTASSPSGRNYGYYKAAAVAAKVPKFLGKGEDRIPNPLWYPELASIHALMTSMPLQHGFTLPRWQRSINLMLEKHPAAE
jgi:hypothetical protein